MAQNFRGGDREQAFLFPPDVREWLAPDHLAWFVIDAVGVMDLDAFYANLSRDGHGRPACTATTHNLQKLHKHFTSRDD